MKEVTDRIPSEKRMFTHRDLIGNRFESKSKERDVFEKNL